MNSSNSGRGGRGGRGRGLPSSNQSGARNPFAASQVGPHQEQQYSQQQSIHRQQQSHQHNNFERERSNQEVTHNGFTRQQLQPADPSQSSRNPFKPQQSELRQDQQQNPHWDQQNLNRYEPTGKNQQQQQGFVRKQNQQPHREDNRDDNNLWYQGNRRQQAVTVQEHAQRNPFQQQGQRAISSPSERNIFSGQSFGYNKEVVPSAFTQSQRTSAPQSQHLYGGSTSTFTSSWNNTPVHQQQPQSHPVKILGLNNASLSQVDASVVVAGALTADFRLDLPPCSSTVEDDDVNLRSSSVAVYIEKMESTVSDGPFASFSEVPPSYCPYSDNTPFRAGFIPNVPPLQPQLNHPLSSSSNFGLRRQ